MKFEFCLHNEDVGPTNIIEAAALANRTDVQLSCCFSNITRQRLMLDRQYLDSLVAQGKQIYGINTGVGFFNHIPLSPDATVKLQRNLILSHCCGVGAPAPRDVVMAMWLILLNSISRGHRGVRYEVVEFIAKTLSHGILAQVPARGSVGASGDLAPSAHAALALLGEGQCTMPVDGRFVEMSASEALLRVGMKPLTLAPKEGLSLINGTQFTTALASKLWYQARMLIQTANMAAALSIEGMRGLHGAMADPILLTHRHPGTLHCGQEIAAWIKQTSGKSKRGHDRIQDPYSLRCAPQVHGAVWEDVESCEDILRKEINASTDNPLVFAEDELILHGGNFHAIYPARVSDRLASALTTLSSISERRINLAMDKEKSGLPYFLVDNGGLSSGLMMIQTTAAALVSECKSLSFPASVDSIPTNCDQEDHVSMGPIAGMKGLQIAENVRNVLSIELIAAAQAIDLLKPAHLSDLLQAVHALIRECCPFLNRDRVLADDIRRVSDLIESRKLLKVRT